MDSDAIRFGFPLRRRRGLVVKLFYQFFEEFLGFLHLFVDPRFRLIICDASVTGGIKPGAPGNARRACAGFVFMVHIAFGLALVELVATLLRRLAVSHGWRGQKDNQRGSR